MANDHSAIASKKKKKNINITIETKAVLLN
jgi:hypothetical protein